MNRVVKNIVKWYLKLRCGEDYHIKLINASGLTVNRWGSLYTITQHDAFIETIHQIYDGNYSLYSTSTYRLSVLINRCIENMNKLDNSDELEQLNYLNTSYMEYMATVSFYMAYMATVSFKKLYNTHKKC